MVLRAVVVAAGLFFAMGGGWLIGFGGGWHFLIEGLALIL